MSRPRIVCLVGPTASGKTALAIELAERIGAEIVSADSRQAYRRLDIGTAKPTRADKSALRLKMICDLPFQFATKTTMEQLLPAIVDQLVEMIPSGESWALVLREPGTDTLLLKAYHYVRRTYLSETLLRRAMSDRKAFIWNKDAEVDISGSVAQSGLEVGMYAPLLWQGEALGAICAGAQNPQTVFTDDDVRLLVVVGQYAAMAVATHRLQERARRDSVVKANLLRQFSPKVAEKLLAHRGRLRLGGQRNEVTILNADIRCFTQLAQEMEPDSVVELLNDYLGVVVPIIFAYNGIIDKFIGDAILAVFGSPDRDPCQHENAIRAAMEIQVAITKLNESRQLRKESCRDFGIGMSNAEVTELTRQVDLAALREYRDAVGRRTREIVGNFGDKDWGGEVAAPSLQKAATEGAFGARAEQLVKGFTGRPRAAVLSGIALFHPAAHLGEAVTVRSAGGFGTGI